MSDTEMIKEKLINNFMRIAKIPRESGHEEKIAEFFINIAKENGLYYFKDENNNVLIKKKGSINSFAISLQAHLDMVCVKDKNTHHDFSKNGIDVIIDGDKVTANNTSLGADQGVGLAIMLTILEDKKLKHPDLEFIFTVEEETTFKGAVTFPYYKVESKRIINLDNSRDDTVLIGANGDICNEYYFKGELTKNTMPSYRIIIDNFPGGNSSEDIELSKNNAISTMVKLLNNEDVFIKSINGGNCDNDLATWCEIELNTNIDINRIFKTVNAKIEKINNQLSFSKEDTNRIINEILELKCGFITDNLASANLGLIKTNNNEIKIYYVFRSSNLEELKMINEKTKLLNNGFIVTEKYNDPIWKVNYNSNMPKKYKEVYYEIYNCYPKEEICHGAIECSSLMERIEGLDIISIGSTIKKYHTTDEVTYISSWVKIYELIELFLEK